MGGQEPRPAQRHSSPNRLAFNAALRNHYAGSWSGILLCVIGLSLTCGQAQKGLGLFGLSERLCGAKNAPTKAILSHPAVTFGLGTSRCPPARAAGSRAAATLLVSHQGSGTGSWSGGIVGVGQEIPWVSLGREVSWGWSRNVRMQ